MTRALRIAILYGGNIYRTLGTPERVLQIALGLTDQRVDVTLAAIRCLTNVDVRKNLHVMTVANRIVTPPHILIWVGKLMASSLVRKYDIVQLESFSLLRNLTLFFVLRPFGRKFVIVFHDKLFKRDPRTSRTGRFQLFLQRTLLTLFDSTVTPGETVKKSFRELHGKIVDEKITVIPNGVPSLDIRDVTDRSYLRTKYRLNAQAFLALFFGSMTFEPNYQAAQRLYSVAGFVSSQFWKITGDKLVFVIAGVGSDTLPKADWFVPIGFVEDINELFSLPDVIVLPHMPSYTGPHLKTIYAFSSGKPVVATNDSVKDMHVFADKHYLLFDINEPDTLLRVLVDLHNNRELGKSLARNAYSYSREHSWKSVSLSHLELYERLLSKTSQDLKLARAERAR